MTIYQDTFKVIGFFPSQVACLDLVYCSLQSMLGISLYYSVWRATLNPTTETGHPSLRSSTTDEVVGPRGNWDQAQGNQRVRK